MVSTTNELAFVLLLSLLWVYSVPETENGSCAVVLICAQKRIESRIKNNYIFLNWTDSANNKGKRCITKQKNFYDEVKAHEHTKAY